MPLVGAGAGEGVLEPLGVADGLWSTLAIDDPVFVRRGGGRGGGGLARAACVWLLSLSRPLSHEDGMSFPDAAVLLLDIPGEGSDSALGPEPRLGGTGGTALRLGGSCAGGLESLSAESEAVATWRREEGFEALAARSAGVETIRKADGLIGFTGGGRGVVGCVSPDGGGLSSMIRSVRSIKSSSSRSCGSGSARTGGERVVPLRGGSFGLLDIASERSLISGELRLRLD